MKRKVTRRRVDTGVAYHRPVSGKKRLFDKRTIRVLGSLVVGMTLVSALLLVLEPDPTNRGSVLALSAMDMSSQSARDEILDVPGSHDWKYIIIHDSRGITGGMKQLDDAWNDYYEDRGMSASRGAGYHFVVNDRGNTQVEIAPRWKHQQAGDYVNGLNSDKWNREAIGICLMGDAENRSVRFKEDQITATVKLVRMLQEKYDIPRERIRIQVGRSADSPAPYFPTGQFMRQVRD